MEFEKLLKIVGDEPVFESSFLLAGDVRPENIRLQLDRWIKAGKIHQLRRGIYLLAAPYQKKKPHPFLVANRLQKPSYVSMQSALSFYGMIPDIVNETVSVTPVRNERLNTHLGVFEFRHINKNYFGGYHLLDIAGQKAFVATPEKAILDLIYLQPGGDTPAFISELRLQNLENLNIEELRKQGKLFDKPKIHRAIRMIELLVKEEYQTYEEL
jgi:predicted transcriptional regulator of viral defense system